MQKLFATETSNFCQSLLLRDFSEWTKISGHLNRDSLLKGWEPLEFSFQVSDKGADTKPDICPVYISGAIAFRGDLKQKIFPSPCCEVEFLPIRVSEEEWMLLNCLKTTRQYDSQKSQLHRIK